VAAQLAALRKGSALQVSNVNQHTYIILMIRILCCISGDRI
jgi:hypothetical protein